VVLLWWNHRSNVRWWWMSRWSWPWMINRSFDPAIAHFRTMRSTPLQYYYSLITSSKCRSSENQIWASHEEFS
jgi:hypothetical protein